MGGVHVDRVRCMDPIHFMGIKVTIIQTVNDKFVVRTQIRPSIYASRFGIVNRVQCFDTFDDVCEEIERTFSVSSGSNKNKKKKKKKKKKDHDDNDDD